MQQETGFEHHNFQQEISNATSIKKILQISLDRENEMMRSYLITAERIHDNSELQTRLRNFAEGNAKRSKQLIDELKLLE